MLILGVESSCDETAAALVENGQRVLASTVASQFALHEEYAGVVPEIASRAHVQAIAPVLSQTLTAAGCALADIDAIAVGHRPGLIGSLLIGLSAAKALAWSLDVPLIGVDHVHAHLYAGLLDTQSPPHPDPQPDPQPDTQPDTDTCAEHTAIDRLYPALGIVVSGGHTSLYVLESPTKLTRIGATIDDALGEAFDKAATILGLPYPGGPNLDALSRTPGANDAAQRFPIARLSKESLDMSFSGLKTSLLYAVRGHPGKGTHGRQGYERTAADLTPERQRDLAASFERAAVDAVVLKATRALDRFEAFSKTPCRSILTGGGVLANTRLRSCLTSLAHERSLPIVLPPREHCVDNAAMIAGLGYHLFCAGSIADLSLEPIPTTAC